MIYWHYSNNRTANFTYIKIVPYYPNPSELTSWQISFIQETFLPIQIIYPKMFPKIPTLCMAINGIFHLPRYIWSKIFLSILIQKGFLKSQPYAVCMAIDGSLGAAQEAAAVEWPRLWRITDLSLVVNKEGQRTMKTAIRIFLTFPSF